MSTEKKAGEAAEVPNSHLANIHSNDNKNVVQEKQEAEKEEREANKIEPGVNTHLADVHAGKVNSEGKNIETVTVPDGEPEVAPKDVERNGGPSSEPAATTPETPVEETATTPETPVEEPAATTPETPVEETATTPAETVETPTAEK